MYAIFRFIKEFTYSRRGRKKLRFNKIYAIDLHNIEVKLIDRKTEIFGNFKKNMLYENIRLIELHCIEVLL